MELFVVITRHCASEKGESCPLYKPIDRTNRERSLSTTRTAAQHAHSALLLLVYTMHRLDSIRFISYSYGGPQGVLRFIIYLSIALRSSRSRVVFPIASLSGALATRRTEPFLSYTEPCGDFDSLISERARHMRRASCYTPVEHPRPLEQLPCRSCCAAASSHLGRLRVAPTTPRTLPYIVPASSFAHLVARPAPSAERRAFHVNAQAVGSKSTASRPLIETMRRRGTTQGQARDRHSAQPEASAPWGAPASPPPLRPRPSSSI